MAAESVYDLVALGRGAAAIKVATVCREAGWRVAVVDGRPFGGTSALRGYEPEKTLWTVVAEVYDRTRLPAGAGKSTGATRVSAGRS